VRIGAASRVIGDVEAGTEVWGYPAREKSRALREMAAAARAAAARERLRALGRRVEELETSLSQERERGGRPGTKGRASKPKRKKRRAGRVKR
jgi:hypothetical protein